MLRRLAFLAAAALLLAACGSTKTVTVTVATTTTSGSSNVSALVAEGAHTFNQFACAQCHGPNGRGGVSPDVPALKVIGKALTPAKLRDIIDHGVGVVNDPKKVYMPVWGHI